LLQAEGVAVPEQAAASWFGLWDLSAAEGTDLLAVAVVHPAGAGVVELDAIAVSAAGGRRAHGHRLLQEVLNRLRAVGADRLVARVPQDEDERGLLLEAGFSAVEPAQDADGAGTWLCREL
jgi:N-acetylglutamate synthase-like GNAT family acetyltransferase